MGGFRPRIAYFSSRRLERTERRLTGLLRFVAEQGDLAVADFRFLEQALPPSPPWIGLAEGAIVASGIHPGILEWMLSGGVPFVCPTGDLCGLPVVAVFSDAHSVARLAAEHFLDLGFRDFAFFGSQSSDASRVWGWAFAEELARHGFALDAHVTHARFFASAEEVPNLLTADPKIAELLTRRRGRLAVLAINDEYAVAICHIAQLLGLAVPDDVAVLGIGDSTVAKIAVPPLSSVLIDFEEIGYQAGRLLHRLMTGKKVPQRHWLVPAFGLVVRESTVGRTGMLETDIDRALAYIHDHACDGISARDVAKQLHLALRTFELQFQGQVGRSPAEEIRRVRLEKAKSLLANTNLSITEIGGQIGYHDSSYFAAFFRQHAGMKPSEYRELPVVQRDTI